MDINEANLTQLSQLFQQALDPRTLKQAEESLRGAEVQANFLPLLMKLMSTSTVAQAIRLNGTLYFKNFIFRQWYKSGEDDCICDADRQFVKTNIIELLVGSPENLQLQVGEAVSLIAETDYPSKWPTLVQELSAKLNPDNFLVNMGVLRTIHSVFKRWRSAIVTEDLNTEIQQSIEAFVPPYFSLLQHTVNLIREAGDTTTLNQLLQCSFMMIKIHFSLCYHDIPQVLFDQGDAVMSSLMYLLTYRNSLIDSKDDDEAGIMEKIRTSIIEFCQLFFNKYCDEFTQRDAFIATTWDIVVSCGPQPKYDMLVCQAMKFFSSVVKRQGSEKYFDGPDALNTMVEKVIIPNGTLRESDIELFEDEPIEYIRREWDGSLSDSRRQSVSELIRALMSRMENNLTLVFKSQCDKFLARYSENPSANWRDKDIAIFLFTAIAIKGHTASHGATQTSSQVDVGQFFAQHILPDLTPDPKRPLILNVDAIKFMHSFRNHLAPDQLLAVLPPLIQQLQSPNYVVHTFSAICIDGILQIKVNQQLIFTEQVLGPHLQSLLDSLFTLCERPGTPEKVAENEFLMRTVMRAIIIGRETISQHKALVAQKLGNLLTIISSNPSNPKYNHYLFECMGAVIRSTSFTLQEFDQYFWPSFNAILSQNTDEFIPYVLQIVALMLDQHKSTEPMPQFFVTFFTPLVQPAIWEHRGNTPALVRLLQSYLTKCTEFCAQKSNLVSILGVYGKLIGSKLHDQHGFEILESVFLNVDSVSLKEFVNPILIRILTRVRDSKTDKLLRGLIHFLSEVAITDQPNLVGLQQIVDGLNSIGPGVTPKLVSEIIAPKLISLASPTDRALVGIGMTRLLMVTINMLQDNSSAWLSMLSQLTLLLGQPKVNLRNNDVENSLDSYELDEDMFQSATFVKLATGSSATTASSVNRRVTKLVGAGNPSTPESYLVRSLNDMNQASNGLVFNLVNTLPEPIRNLIQQFSSMPPPVIPQQ